MIKMCDDISSSLQVYKLYGGNGEQKFTSSANTCALYWWFSLFIPRVKVEYRVFIIL